MHDFTFIHVEQHCQSCDQLNILCKSDCNILIWSLLATLLTIFVSSANFRILLTTPSSKSFMKIMNDKGPKIDPWGTPLITAVNLERIPLITTHCSLSANQFSIQFIIEPVIPCALNFCNNLRWGTLSNAFWKSRYITSTGSPASIWFTTFLFCWYHAYCIICMSLAILLGRIAILYP